MSLWAETGKQGTKFGSMRAGPAHLEAVERLKDWTRGRFALGEDDTVVVAENARSLPGFPPLDTVVAFWTAAGARHHFRVFKPVEAVVEEDVPPAWLRDALADAAGIECECC